MEQNSFNNNQSNSRKPLSFGRTVLAAGLGVIVAGLVLGFISFIMMISALVSMTKSVSSDTAVNVKESTFVKIDLTKPVTEQAPSGFETFVSDTRAYGLNDLLLVIDKAKTDPHVSGLYLLMSSTTQLGWGMAEELREALLDFASSGKPICTYGEGYSQPAYYVATAANEIHIHPDGMLDFRGIGSQVMYYKDLFDKLGVKVDLIRPESCAYKSAGETYTMNHMSEANREQIHVYINSIWNHVSNGIAAARKMDVARVNQIADSLTGYLAADAFSRGLVDFLSFEKSFRTSLQENHNAKHFLSASKYLTYARQLQSQELKEKCAIAVVYAEGNVQAGNYPGYGSGIYTNRMVKAIDDAAKDDNVKAIVLRVNSPGGAATTSESITAAVRRAKEKKPVIVSMSDVAASAGYEISALANGIVAQPTTITGSIGVFGTLPEIGTMLRKKVGITFDTVQTNKNSTALSLTAPLSPTARAMMQRNVEDFYKVFVGVVAEGRKMNFEAVDAIARGRVWTGQDAMRLGLVDSLGGIQTAIRWAARLAKVNKYHVVEYPKQKDFMAQLSSMMNKDDDEDNTFSLLFHPAKVLRFYQYRNSIVIDRTLEGRIREDLESLTQEPSLQARLPYFLVIQ